MDKQSIDVIMKFMFRVNLTGQEVPAFNLAMNALQAELERANDTVDEVSDGANK
ncbi:TPA: hypothetical protein IBU99_000080 [Escherichia coli]|uniref:hypothetical protein n=1 Tax=Escherichia coli TaxID=562 RepID=UPI000B155937|nr:hypothetical protein [Escherichia coli]HAM3893564.1 hypothetical protein [Escherichia coli]HCJ5767915.1 hypothetical protein [Escherichia coli]HCJ5883649.1 hypothetical protein [Escherichia coli]HCJ6094028.1 hypothetical protein [Escherichia coli]HCJ8412442.1 hypothetical protein [Escherichia coli]